MTTKTMDDKASGNLSQETLSSFPLKKETEGERKVKFQTAKEVIQEAPTELEWLLKFWIPLGAIIAIVGLPKLAGKTTFLLRIVRALVYGGSFMNKMASKTPVVYLCEGPPQSFVEALREAGLEESVDLHIAYKHQFSKLLWPETINEAAQQCADSGAKVLIIDTISSFIRFKGDAENSSSAVIEALDPLKSIAAEGITVIIVRHARKGAGDIISSGRGSDAFEGEVDHVIRIQRLEAQRENVRFIDSVG